MAGPLTHGLGRPTRVLTPSPLCWSLTNGPRPSALSSSLRHQPGSAQARRPRGPSLRGDAERLPLDLTPPLLPPMHALPLSLPTGYAHGGRRLGSLIDRPQEPGRARTNELESFQRGWGVCCSHRRARRGSLRRWRR